jgi:hypothetical protein
MKDATGDQREREIGTAVFAMGPGAAESPSGQSKGDQ